MFDLHISKIHPFAPLGLSSNHPTAPSPARKDLGEGQPHENRQPEEAREREEPDQPGLFAQPHEIDENQRRLRGGEPQRDRRGPGSPAAAARRPPSNRAASAARDKPARRVRERGCSRSWMVGDEIQQRVEKDPDAINEVPVQAHHDNRLVLGAGEPSPVVLPAQPGERAQAHMAGDNRRADPVTTGISPKLSSAARARGLPLEAGRVPRDSGPARPAEERPGQVDQRQQIADPRTAAPQRRDHVQRVELRRIDV
jgi:hypothetical protein